MSVKTFFKDIFIALSIYTIIMLPFLNIIPYLDGNIDFVKAGDFQVGGFEQLFNNWNSVHPPLKIISYNYLSIIFGESVLVYQLMGFAAGIVGIVYIYKLSSLLFGRRSGIISSILLSVSPLYLSVGLFALEDFLLTVWVIASVYYYSKNKYYAYALTSSLAVLTKETGIILVFSVIIAELDRIVFKRQIKGVLNLSNFLVLLFPIFTSSLWIGFLNVHNKTLWSDWNFSINSGKGSVYTVIQNLISFEFLNKYAYQNWKQYFMLNFNWVFWLIISISVIVVMGNSTFRKKIIHKLKSQRKTLLSIAIFWVTYLLSVLSFQTYTIPRYALPIIFVPIVLVGYIFTFIDFRYSIVKSVVGVLFGMLIVTRLFFSVDPISKYLWGETIVLNENLYALNEHLSGNDGITYNMQYGTIAKTRSKILLGNRNLKSKNDCFWIFADPNNDLKTLGRLNITPNICLNRN